MIKTALITLMWCALAARCAAADPAPDTMWSHEKVDGRWNAGDPSWHDPDRVYLGSRGMIAVSVEYRLKTRDGADVPLDCVNETKSAVRFLRKSNTKLNIDTTAWIDPDFTGSVRNKMQFPRT